MSDRAWKATERRTAAILGGHRTGVSRQRESAGVPDVDAGWIVAEVKHRKALPVWIHNAMAQARAAARSNQLPIAVLHEAGQRHADNLVLLRLADFRDWFGNVEVIDNE